MEKYTGHDWMRMIDLGIRFKEEVGGANAWDRYKSYYVGNYNVDGKGIIPVNMIFANGKVMVPKCYFRNPKVKVTPLQPKNHYSSFVVDSLINQLIRELRVKYQMKAMIEDCYATGTSFGKLGFDSEYGFVPDKQDTQTDKKGNQIEYNVNIKNGQPWFKWADAESVVVPWGAAKSGDPEITDIPWIANRVVRHIDDVKSDPKYKNTKELKGEYKPDIDINRVKHNEDVNYIELWEIRDIKRKRIYVVTREKEGFLMDEEDSLQIEGFPYVQLQFNTHPKYFWGISDIRQLEPHQMALNVAYTIFVNHIRLSLKKIIYQKDQLVNIDELLSDKFAAAIACTGDVNSVVKELNISIPPDIINAINQIRMTIRELVGYSRNEAGEFDSSSRRTATEANLVKAGSETRSSERRDIVADVLERTCQKLLQIVLTHWDKSQVVPIIGEDGVKYWVEYSADDIRGEYQFLINAEEAQPVDSNSIKEDAMGLLKLLQEDPDFAPEERKKLKMALFSQFTHLGIDPEKALMPREGMGGSPEQPVPMQQWAGGMEKAKRNPKAGGQQQMQQMMQALQGGK